jgi:drug/metabolite transporter (DMT)-like permease
MFGVLRGAERPKAAFWLFAAIGAATVMGFALSRSSGGATTGDLLMFGAIVVCGLGYAEGAILTRRLGGWQVISWALLLSLPVMAAVTLFSLPGDWSGIGVAAWIGLGYVSVFSMLVGFIFWYHGLALGGIARVGQLQLLQPFIGLILAAVLLGEPIAWTMIASAAIVVLCVAGAKRFA